MSDDWNESENVPGPQMQGRLGPRVFTVEEATALLPKMEAAFVALDRIRERLKAVKSKMDVLEMIHGSGILNVEGPDRREYAQCLSEVDGIRKQYEVECAGVHELGGYLKATEDGLVDFYGVVDGRLVWLCWKRGEAAIAHYHHLEDGFTGRRPLPESRRA